MRWPAPPCMHRGRGHRSSACASSTGRRATGAPPSCIAHRCDGTRRNVRARDEPSAGTPWRNAGRRVAFPPNHGDGGGHVVGVRLSRRPPASPHARTPGNGEQHDALLRRQCLPAIASPAPCGGACGGHREPWLRATQPQKRQCGRRRHGRGQAWRLAGCGFVAKLPYRRCTAVWKVFGPTPLT